MQTTRCGRTWLDESGVVLVENLAGADQTLEDAIENIRVTAIECGGVRRPTLVDLTGLKAISRDARNYYASPAGTRHATAIALVVGSPLSRMMGNFFIGMNRLAVPVRLFGTRQDAMAWLLAQAPR